MNYVVDTQNRKERDDIHTTDIAVMIASILEVKGTIAVVLEGWMQIKTGSKTFAIEVKDSLNCL